MLGKNPHPQNEDKRIGHTQNLMNRNSERKQI